MMHNQFELFVPGRICLFGEHSDWAAGYRRINSEIEKGYTIITGTNQGLYARVRSHPDKLVFHSVTEEGRRSSFELPMEPALLKAAAEEGGFFSYVCGVAYQMLTHYQVGGLEIDNYETDLPLKKGLSSSAAVCVLTARAFNRVYDLKMTTRGEMEMAYRGETTTPSRCGRMDQGCAYGNKPILMTYDADLLEVEELTVPRDLHYVIVDLKANKNTVKILADLNHAFPFADNEIEKSVQRYLGPVNKEIVRRARTAIESGDLLTLGTLMTEAQTGFDTHLGPASPEELTAPVLHKTLSAPELAESTLGGKGVGSQGDGSAQFLVADEGGQREVMEILQEKLGLSCLPLTIPRTRRVRKAVITAAGRGTRLFPMTKLIRKEFMPVVDASGTMMPLLIKHLLEAQDAGIEEVLLIIRPEEEADFRRLILEPVAPEVFQKLSTENQKLARRLEELAGRITLVPQREQRGLGHAVLSVADHIGEEPFLLVLGDHHFVSHRDESTYAQLVRAYHHVDENIIGIVETGEADIHRFGTVGGSWERERELLSISSLIEKPGVEEAREYLRVEGLSEGAYYTVFGLYILTPVLFDILRRMEAEHEYDRGELQLTGALEHLRRDYGMLGLPIEGEKIDIGVPSDFVRSLASADNTV